MKCLFDEEMLCRNRYVNDSRDCEECTYYKKLCKINNYESKKK